MKKLNLIITILISSCLFFGCKNQNTKVYLYRSHLKSNSINNTYDENGYPNPYEGIRNPNPYEGNWCKWGLGITDKSLILIDQSNNSIKILDQNIVEEYNIIKTKSQEGPKIAFSFIAWVKNSEGKDCTFSIGDCEELYSSICIQVMIPYEPARMYMVTRIDYEELTRKFKTRVDAIPR